MNIDQVQLRELLVNVLETFRRMEHELLVHQIVIRELGQTTEIEYELERVLSAVRRSPVLLDHLCEKYDEALEALLRQLGVTSDEGAGGARSAFVRPN